jgi:aminoglycoside 6-adenylyltransferase
LSFIVRSRARRDHPADRWADLDIMTFTTNPKSYLVQTDWMTEMGNVWVKTRHHTFTNDAEWLVSFEGGIDVDFVFSSYPKMRWKMMLWLTENFPSLKHLTPRKIINYLQIGAQTMNRGVQVLIDKDNIASSMLNFLESFKSVSQPPTQTKFIELVEYFWCMAEKTAKKICRESFMLLVLGVIICIIPLYFRCWSGIHALDTVGIAILGIKDVFWKSGRISAR